MVDKPRFLDQEGVKFLWDKVLELMSDVGDGKSAYEIAKELGFEGSEEEWIQSLEGSSGVYIGPNEPTEDIDVWLDTAGTSSEIDTVPLVDTVGQTRYHLFVYEGQLALKEEGNDKPVYFLTGNDKQILEEQIKNNKTDLTGYATEQYVTDAISAIEIPEVDLTAYYNKEEINAIMGAYITDIDTLVGGAE